MFGMMKMAIVIGLGGVLVLGCTTPLGDESGEGGTLEIHSANEGGIAGEYRVDGTAIYFESRRATREADAPLTFVSRFFDEAGVTLAARYPGTAAPAEWATTSNSREPSSEVLALVPLAIDALANAELASGSVDAPRDSLVDLRAELSTEVGTEQLAASGWLYFGAYCGVYEEFGSAAAWNDSYSYYRWASITFYDGWGSHTMAGWVAPRTTRRFVLGTYKLSSAWASGNLSFWVSGNWCGSQRLVW